MKAFFQRLTWVDYVLALIRFAIIGAIVVGITRSLFFLDVSYSTEDWVQIITAGIAQGSVYALIALGYTLVYGILLMINFAHGEVFMGGAFTAYFLALKLNKSGFMDSYPYLSLIILILFASLVSMFIAILLERIAYRPLRGSPRLVPLITAIGASFFLQYTFKGLYGSKFYTYPRPDAILQKVQIGGFTVEGNRIFVFVSALILMAALYWLVERTKLGTAMRAVSENKEVARLMGIDIDKVIVLTFAIGGALAGAAGVINAMYVPQGVNFHMGFFPGIKAFTAAVLGGIGSVPGAMLGGLLLGIIEAIGPRLILGGLGIPSTHQLKDVIAFTMLVLVLMFRPQGIMGEKLAEKKA